MSRPSDDRLVAYLDGEITGAERREIEAWLESEPDARSRLAALAESAELLREAYADVLREAVPDRLIAAARGTTLGPQTGARRSAAWRVAARAGRSRWWVALPISASLCGFVAGGGATYFGILHGLAPGLGAEAASGAGATTAQNLWLDNAAGDFKLFASTGDKALIDVPASGDSREALQKISQTLTQQVRLPDLRPWGLNFQGARLLVVDGKPAAQLIYTTDNKAIGPLALIIGSTQQPDIRPTFDHRQGVNMLYWRHQGRAYVLVGQADAGYLWGIGNDVAWQLDAI